jgi:putative transposase
MKKSRFTETQIVSILMQYDGGSAAAELCREQGVRTATLYNWKAKYGGLESNQLKSIKELEDENNKLKRMYADVSIQQDALKDLVEKKALAPADKR